MSVNNGAALKVIEKQPREYNALILEHNDLLEVHIKTVNDFAKLDLKAYELRKDNRDLRKIIKQWEKENEILQESLDGCQLDNDRLHGEIDHLISKYGGD